MTKRKRQPPAPVPTPAPVVQSTNGALRFVAHGLALAAKLETSWPATQRIGKIRRALKAPLEDLNEAIEKIGNKYCDKGDGQGFVRSVARDSGILVSLVAADPADQKTVNDLFTDLLKQEVSVATVRLTAKDFERPDGFEPLDVPEEILEFLGPFYDWQDGLDERANGVAPDSEPEGEE